MLKRANHCDRRPDNDAKLVQGALHDLPKPASLALQKMTVLVIIVVLDVKSLARTLSAFPLASLVVYSAAVEYTDNGAVAALSLFRLSRRLATDHSDVSVCVR